MQVQDRVQAGDVGSQVMQWKGVEEVHSLRIFRKHIARICLLMRQVDNQVLSVIDDHLRTEMDEHVALAIKQKSILILLNQSALVVAFQSDNSHLDSSLPTPCLTYFYFWGQLL